MRPALAALAACAAAVAALAPAAALGATTLTGPTFDTKGHLVQTPFVPPANAPTLTSARVLQLFEANSKVAHWLDRYPTSGRATDQTYSTTTHSWTVKIWWGAAGEIAQGVVDDATGTVLQAYTGPQVAWGMARGGPGAFGGRTLNNPWVWGAFMLVFAVGLADLRRLRSLRNLDLLFLLSPTASLWFFNHGDIFTSVPLFYPALLWVVLRCTWIGARGRATSGRPVWPVWVLLAATVFVAGFRVGLNIEASNVIDVGYSGVIGAERIVHDGQAPWGNFPIEGNLKACGPADSNGEIRNRIQTNGRCEGANPQGDTYGPVAYEAYIPGYLAEGWSGVWDSLPAAHFTSLLFDLLTVVGLWLVGLRFGGGRLAAMLGFAWVAYPFTQYASNSNTNDTIMPCLLVFGFWLATGPAGRGVFAALSGWTKFAALVVAPLWLTYPDRRPKPRYLAGFALATLAAFSIVLLAPHPIHELGVFWRRTIVWQSGRASPFSLWDWRQYHARGLPNLHAVQRALQVLLVLGALAAAWWPRTKSPLQLAALTAALLAGFEMVMTYWLYTYIPWFFAFAAIALLATRSDLDAKELDPARPPVVAALDDDALDPDAALGGLEPDGLAGTHAGDREL